MDPQYPNQLSFWHYLLQQQQPQLQYSSSGQFYSATPSQLNWLHQQNLLQLHKEQQEQQRSMLSLPQELYDSYHHHHQQQQQQQQQQQIQPQQNMMPVAIPSPMKPAYEPGTCGRILIHYMHHQQLRPDDNKIEFWNDFVAQYFAPNAIKKLCLSMHEGGKKLPTSVSPVWQCKMCNHNSGNGFEISFENLPRLFKVKYDSGISEELLHVNKHKEYINSSGQIVLLCRIVTRESVFDHFRVVHYGNLRITFAPVNLKICSWEFCVRSHEVYMVRRSLIPMVNELGAVAQNCKALTENQESSNNIFVAELQNNCGMMAASAKRLANTLEVPLNDDLGYTKKYVRFLEMSQVANNIKDLIDFSREKEIGAIETLDKFP